MNELNNKISEVENECYLIDKGVRSCALLSISGFYQNQIDIISKMEEIVLNHKLHSYTFKQRFLDCDLEVYTFWIYKYHHQLALIKYLENKSNKDLCSEWITGKLLGYSDESIEEYLAMKLIDRLEIISMEERN